MARSRPYRSRFLQVNTRWKALDEIYKIYMLLHRSDLNISANFRHEFLRIDYFSQFFKHRRQNCSMIVPIRAETSPIFFGISQIFQKFLPQSTYRKSEENPRILRTATKII